MSNDMQTLPRPIREGDLERYEQWAIEASAHIKPGTVNWPMMVRSLVEEVRRLKANHAYATHPGNIGKNWDGSEVS